MRNRFAIATAAALILSLGIWAQEKQVQDPAESKQLNMQASKRLVIKESMQLDDKQGELFWPLYNQYDVEQTKLADEKLALIEAYAHDFLTMNDQKADQLANQALQLEDKRLALRRKYYELMKKSLPTTVVVRFFQLQNQIDLIVDLQIASHLPIIEEAPPKQ